MDTVIATSLNGKIELLTNGNHSYWTRPVSGTFRNRYKQFAGRTLDAALKSLAARASIGY